MAEPLAVVIVGASANREKFGNKAVRAHLRAGYRVYPVNPREDVIEGLSCYASITDVPGPVDRVSLYVPPPVGLTLLDAIVAKQPKELWLNPGAESEELINAAQAKGLNVVVACSIVGLGMSPAGL